MKRHFQLLAIGLLCSLTVALFARRTFSESAPDSPAKPVPAASEPASATSATSREVLTGVKPGETLARVKELEKMVLEKRQRDQAEEGTHIARASLQFYKRQAWKEVIQANQQRFEDLRKEAAQSPNKLVPCTICDAKGVLDLCVVCDHTGKCPTCRGTGRHLDGVCSTCLGRGKCFLCFGLGKMPCPFCQSLPLRKEVITPDTPDPSAEIPIN